MPVFRVKDTKKNLYMTKNKRYPHWTEEGDVYTSLSGAKTAIRTRKAYSGDPRYDDDPDRVVIIEYDLVEKVVHSV
jgi:hypothetical protein